MSMMTEVTRHINTLKTGRQLSNQKYKWIEKIYEPEGKRMSYFLLIQNNHKLKRNLHQVSISESNPGP